jgi:hypothetical protein
MYVSGNEVLGAVILLVLYGAMPREELLSVCREERKEIVPA